jgi:hypothetical protein
VLRLGVSSIRGVSELEGASVLRCSWDAASNVDEATLRETAPYGLTAGEVGPIEGGQARFRYHVTDCNGFASYR